MDRTETAKLLGYLKATYINSFSKMDESEKEAMILVWANHFKNDDFNHVMRAVENLCQTSKFVPSVADIKEEMFKVSNVKQKDVGEAWAIAHKNCSCNPQIAKENYDKLPANIQKALGSSSVLVEIGWMNNEQVSFARNSFEKKYEIILERERKDLASGLLTYSQVEINNTLPAPKEQKGLTLNFIKQIESKME